jgi:hypothetical protein
MGLSPILNALLATSIPRRFGRLLRMLEQRVTQEAVGGAGFAADNAAPGAEPPYHPIALARKSVDRTLAG